MSNGSERIPETSDAEVLREAARLMRERAEVSDWDPVPARVDITQEGTCDACAETKPLVASYPEPDNEPWLCSTCAGAADYIASWHPAVALAVADWLDATTHYPYEDCGKESCQDCGMWRAALTAARTYLGSAS